MPSAFNYAWISRCCWPVQQALPSRGGAAINLFEHYLPRLSVDIDLTAYWRL